MSWVFSPYGFVLFICSIAAAWVAVYAWRRRDQVGLGPALFLLGATVWSLGYGVALGIHDLAARILLAKVQHIGIALTSVALMIFVFYYLGHEDRLNRRTIVLISAIPFIGLLLAWTNEYHGLIWAHIQPRIVGSLTLLDFEYGPYFWFYIIYNGLVIGFSSFVFLHAALFAPQLKRRQAATMFAGTLVVGVTMIFNLAKIRPLPGLDLMPFAISISSLLLAWGLFRYQLFEIVPLAREIVVDKIVDGVLALDRDGRVVDANPAMLRIIGRPANQIMGRPVTEILDGQFSILERYRASPEAHTEIALYFDEKLSYFELEISSLSSKKGDFSGQVLLLRDITERKLAEDALQQTHEQLNATLNALPDLMFEVSSDGMIYDFRSSRAELFTELPNGILGKKLDELLPEDVVKKIMRALEHARRKGQYHGAVFSLPLSNAVRWYELSIAAKGISQGSVDRFVVLARDISERKKVEDALREKEQRFRELYATIQRQAKEKGLLDKVRTALARELDLPLVIRNVVDGIVGTFGYSLVSLYLRSGEVLRLQYQVGYKAVIDEIPIDKGISGRVVRTGQPILVKDVQDDADFLKAVPGIISEICVPLFDRGQVVGIINVESCHEELTTDDLRLLKELGEHISVAVGRARLYTEIQQSEELYRLLFYQSPVGIIHFDPQLRVTDCNNYLADIFQARREEILGFDMHMLDDQSVLPALAQVTNGENGKYEGYFRTTADANPLWISMQASPIFDNHAQVRGGVGIIEDISERKQTHDRLQSQLAEIQLLQGELRERSLRDPLTGLYNRRFLQETLPHELARLKRLQHPLGLIMADIDHFKVVNDSYGHDAGDIVLQELSRLLKANIREGDIACRYGGEEFVIVMPEASLQICQQRAEDIRTQFDSLRIDYHQYKLHVTISLGVAAFPQHGTNGEEVLNRADQAMYRAKQAGRNRVMIN